MGAGEGDEIDEYNDLSREAGVRLGELVKQKYHTDCYILGMLLHCFDHRHTNEMTPRQIPIRSTTFL